MPTATRSKKLKSGSEANPRPSTPPLPKQTPATARPNTSTSVRAKSRGGANDVGPAPQAQKSTPAGRRKREFADIEESDEGTETHPTNATPSSSHKTDIVASPTDSNINKVALGVMPLREIKKIEFASLEEMALKCFVEVLGKKQINARMAETQDFSTLEVDEPKQKTAVCWKTIPGSGSSSVKIPDTATFGECSVFAVKASSPERFKEKAKTCLATNMISKTLERSMALVLHYDGDGKPQSAIVGYPMGEPLHYCDSIEAETGNKIAMELSRVKDPKRWLLTLPRDTSSKRRKPNDIRDSDSA